MFNRPFMLYILGSMLSKIAWLMFIPLIVTFFHNGDGLVGFLICIGITHFVAFILTRKKPQDMRLRVKDMLLLTTLIWLMSCVFSALPFIIIGDFSFTDAYFETVSGLTTTGSSIIVDVSNTSPALLMWRSTLQWIGGLGFIVMAVAILPFLNVGGMTLFRTESSDKSDKILPQARDVAKSIIQIYLFLTVVCLFAYMWSEMGFFDAINHAFTTIATGGFSTRSGSMAEFNSTTQWICVFFMFVGSLPFLLMVQSIYRRNIFILFRDQQLMGFSLFIFVISLFLAIWLYYENVFNWQDSLRYSLFTLVNIMSTSGFSLGNFDTWTSTTTMIFTVAFILGGCSGSTTGGIKIFRFQIMFQVLKHQILRLIHPNSISAVHYNRHIVSNETVFGIVGFIFSYFMIMAILAVLMGMSGMDFQSAWSSAATSIGNVGPGFGNQVGASGNFSMIPTVSKWLMILGMLLGRLEIMTILVLLFPHFWKK
ncbi:TrkH family potassium uptake protein [Gallibacterium trehalosifermentans]|uniref:Trk system potassium uptake protein n=1 Tax=Gallibacterium trehalosifermentans TaxID=516935 RepID=A0ABV6GZ79_9PAST